MNDEDCDKCLFTFQDICDELEIKTVLLIGTCLGFYRDGKYIPKDFDLDVGVFCTKEKLVMLFKKLRESGFEQKELWKNQGWELNQHFWQDKILLDIHFQYLKDEEPFFEKLETLEYKGRIFNIPSPVERYLELQYGDWQILHNDFAHRSRPLKGNREMMAGGPTKSEPMDLNKYLQYKDKRYEGGDIWIEF